MKTNMNSRLPMLFLNRVHFDGGQCIKLYFHYNERIIRRISQNDWIKHSIELGAYYTREYGHTISVIQDLFDDVAQVNISKLDWKRVVVTQTNIGKTPNYQKSLVRGPKKEIITLFSYDIEGEKRIGFRHFLKKNIYKELVNSSLIIYNRANSLWELNHQNRRLKSCIEFLLKHFTVKLNSEISVSDLEIKRLLLEQSYVKDFQYKSCPLEFFKYLQSNNYSENTLISYHNSVLKFLNAFKGLSIDKINRFGEGEINRYHEVWNQRSAPSPSLINQSINAIKLYYKVVGKQDLDFGKVIRPMKNRLLPTVYSQSEVKKIVMSIPNIKHKTIIFLIYSAGLRISEVINIEVKDILFDRKLVFVKKSKGRKDRYTTLAESAILLIKEYIKDANPTHYLFEGQYGGRYSSLYNS